MTILRIRNAIAIYIAKEIKKTTKIIAFLARGISSSYKVLTSFSSLLEAKLRFISYKGLISLLTPNIANL